MHRWPSAERGGRAAQVLASILLATLVAACQQDLASPLGSVERTPQLDNPQCVGLALPLNATNVAKDGIPALSEPMFVAPDAPGAAYVDGETRVVGIVVGGEALAIPLNILWWHEIVNLRRGSQDVAVTYCPLTGTSLSFDRSVVNGLELRVSGLLHDNNLVMFDRSSSESLWGQMASVALCGPARGQLLPTVQSLETNFAEWRSMHPDTRVTSSETGYDRNYTVNPYEDYWRPEAPPLYGANPPDRRLPPKELVLAIPAGQSGGVVIPFSGRAPTTREALNMDVDDASMVAFWDGPSRTAAAYFAIAEWPTGFEADPGPLTFDAIDGGYVDRETGSLWNLEGVAIDGPGVGGKLVRDPGSYVAFWFAWAALRPDSDIYAD